MKLTDEIKEQIDALGYSNLLERWRYAPLDDPMFNGESGEYWSKRMQFLKSQPGGLEEATRASKMIGWER